MGREVGLDGKTVIGVAKTRLDGRILYLDILYGNRVILPDGSVSSIEPAIYERILREYLERPRQEEALPAPAPEESGEEENWFRKEEDYGIREETPTEEQEAKARRLRGDSSSFFYRSGEYAAESAGSGEEERRSEERAERDEAQLAADEAEDVPFTRLLEPGRERRGAGLIWALIGVIVALCLLLMLSRTGLI